MSYAAITHFAQSWGLVILFVLFAAATLYALWPSNRAKFDSASRMPLEEDDHGGA